MSANRALKNSVPLEPSLECKPGKFHRNSDHRNPPMSAIRLLQYVFIPSPWSSGDQARILLVTHFADAIPRKIGPAETRIQVQVPHANCPAFIVCLSTLRPLTHTGYARDAPKTTIGNGLAEHQSQNNKKGKAASMGGFNQFPSGKPVARPTPWIIKRQVQ